MPEKKDEIKHPDRPLECSECKKPITVHYSEIVGSEITFTGMCDTCPELRKHLKGTPEDIFTKTGEGKTGLVCGECGTTLDYVKIARILGCEHCYKIFGDVVIDDMITSGKIPIKAGKKVVKQTLHVGRCPGETHELSPTIRLIALNEALEETIKKEDYEQAAWLRDQITAITKESKDKDEKRE